MSYETLDAIADAYSPLLLLAIALLLMRRYFAQDWRQSVGLLTTVLLYLAGVYGLMLLDKSLLLWGNLGMDYSTHTAFAAVCVWFLWANNRPRVWALLWPTSLMAYFALMVYQAYHTWMDIVSTLAVIAIWLGVVDRVVRHRRSSVKSESSDSSQTRGYGHNPDPNRRG